MSESTRDTGRLGERMAVEFLEKAGYEIITRNWVFERAEIDIVARIPGRIVFVEVKMRYTDSYGEPWEAVNQRKRRQIIKAADAYMVQHGHEEEARFDIVSIIKREGRFDISHLEEAFWPMA